MHAARRTRGHDAQLFQEWVVVLVAGAVDHLRGWGSLRPESQTRLRAAPLCTLDVQSRS